jgi:GNAT superfamily N-acetyltransferase
MPMDGRWAIRLYHEGDEGALLQLRTLCFPKDDPRSQRERQMWLRRNPYGCQGWVAAAGGEVIGYEGLLLAPLQLLNHQAFAGIRFDLMVAPRHRGKGIGHALVSTCHREIEQSGAELSLWVGWVWGCGVSDIRSPKPTIQLCIVLNPSILT